MATDKTKWKETGSILKYNIKQDLRANSGEWRLANKEEEGIENSIQRYSHNNPCTAQKVEVDCGQTMCKEEKNAK